MTVTLRELCLIGYASETVISHFITVLKEKGVSFTFFDVEQEVLDKDWALILTPDGLLWSTSRGGFVLPYESSIYHRFFYRQEPDQAHAQRLQNAFDVFTAFCIASSDTSLIINRPLSGVMNWAKVAHMYTLLNFGFRIPPALVTNSRDALLDFPHSAINKGCSGTRTVAKQVSSLDFSDCSRNLRAPTMVQSFVSGPDVRVHCVGYEYFALKIETNYDDYRYASQNGYDIGMQQVELPPGLAEKCWCYMKAERLEFAGFDFKIDESNEWWLLEANPMPGFAFFDKHCENRISEMLLKKLIAGYGSFYEIEGLRDTFIGPERIPDVDRGRVSDGRRN